MHWKPCVLIMRAGRLLQWYAAFTCIENNCCKMHHTDNCVMHVIARLIASFFRSWSKSALTHKFIPLFFVPNFCVQFQIPKMFVTANVLIWPTWPSIGKGEVKYQCQWYITLMSLTAVSCSCQCEWFLYQKHWINFISVKFIFACHCCT